MLRRASGSLLPLAIRAVGSPRVFHGAISAAVKPIKDTLAPNFNGASSLRFSTLAKPSSDQELAQEPQTVETMADGFPFKIQNSENAITMLREWKDETITLEVGIPQDDGFNMPFRAVYSATLTITKEYKYLKLGVRIAPDKFSIKSLSERYTEPPLYIKAEAEAEAKAEAEAEAKAEAEDEAESDSDSNSGYEAEAEAEAESGSDTDSYSDYKYKYYQCGMDYDLLDELDDKYFELDWNFSPGDEKGLAKFLKRRGITLKFTNYLHDYITTHMRKRRYALQDLAGEP